MKVALAMSPVGAFQAERRVAASQCRKGKQAMVDVSSIHSNASLVSLDDVLSVAADLKRDRVWPFSVEVQIGIAQLKQSATVEAKWAESSLTQSPAHSLRASARCNLQAFPRPGQSIAAPLGWPVFFLAPSAPLASP